MLFSTIFDQRVDFHTFLSSWMKLALDIKGPLCFERKEKRVKRHFYQRIANFEFSSMQRVLLLTSVRRSQLHKQGMKFYRGHPETSLTTKGGEGVSQIPTLIHNPCSKLVKEWRKVEVNNIQNPVNVAYGCLLTR